MAKRRKPPFGSEVGYGRPPKHTQFKPGKSGNPNGRPKIDETTAMLLKRIASEKIDVVEGGRRMRVMKWEAFARSLIANAIKGKPNAVRHALDLHATSDNDTRARNSRVIVTIVRPKARSAQGINDDDKEGEGG